MCLFGQIKKLTIPNIKKLTIPSEYIEQQQNWIHNIYAKQRKHHEDCQQWAPQKLFLSCQSFITQYNQQTFGEAYFKENMDMIASEC